MMPYNTITYNSIVCTRIPYNTITYNRERQAFDANEAYRSLVATYISTT